MYHLTMLYIALLQLPGIGRKTINRSIVINKSDLCTPETITEILLNARARSSRIREYAEAEIMAAYKKAGEIMEICARDEIKIVTKQEDDYPARLRDSDDPPAVLFYKGDIRILNTHKTIAIVGTREPTEYGYKIGVRVGEKVAEAGAVVVSGLAVGCDTSGHTGALNAHGYTAAVLANGLDTVYPASNKMLAEEIVKTGGCLISEYPPQTEVQRGYFVDRDRLQAALSDALFVVETGVTGGTMHTVEFAKKYNRNIYCFKHPEKYINEPKAQGNIQMISNGTAIGVYSREDIQNMLDAVLMEAPKRDAKPAQAAPYQMSVYDLE